MGSHQFCCVSDALGLPWWRQWWSCCRSSCSPGQWSGRWSLSLDSCPFWAHQLTYERRERGDWGEKYLGTSGCSRATLPFFFFYSGVLFYSLGCFVSLVLLREYSLQIVPLKHVYTPCKEDLRSIHSTHRWFGSNLMSLYWRCTELTMLTCISLLAKDDGSQVMHTECSTDRFLTR